MVRGKRFRIVVIQVATAGKKLWGDKYKLLLAFGFVCCVVAVNITEARLAGAEEVAALFILKCPLNALSGLNCPTCGLGRSLVCAAAGELKQSMLWHPLGVPALLLTAVGILWFLIDDKTIVTTIRGLFGCRIIRILFLILLPIYVIWGFSRNFS